MRKRHLVLVLVFMMSGYALAAPQGEKGASEQAYEHASDNAVFNRVSDWFATVGKNKEEKDKILAQRKAKRAAQRAEKEAQKMKSEGEDAAKKMKKGAEEDAEKMKQETERVRTEAQKEMKKMGEGMGGPGRKR